MSQPSYFIPDLAPDACHETTLIVRRSRFLTHIARARDTAEARAFIESMRARHADATHNCWAFNAGPPGSTARIGASDDGEPHGTAGRPMLNVLLHADVGEICCVVTRWFGGVKLGTGGLVRAYQDCVCGCLETLPRVLLTPMTDLLLKMDYADNERVRRLLDRCGARIRNEDYGAVIVLEVELPRSALESFQEALGEVTSGRAFALELNDSSEAGTDRS